VSSRADDLRALADVVERHDDLVAEYEAELDAYRANPSEANRIAYQAAKAALVDNRQTSRSMEGRTGMTIGGDAFIVTADTTPEG
jgi:hypothetical protein